MNLILIIIITAILQYFAPWWTIAFAPFIILFWRPAETSFKAFLIGFAAVALLWLSYGLYLHFSTEGAMSNRIAQIFSLPNGILLLMVTTFVGGLIGGFAALSGCLVRKAIR